VLDRLGAAQTALEATGCEGRKQRHPVHPRGVPGGRLDTAGDEPVRHGVQRSGGGAKGTHELLGRAGRHAGHDRMGANGDPSRLGGDCAQAVKRTGCALGRSDTMPLTEWTHGGLLAGAITLGPVSRRVDSSGSMPPVSDAGMSENHVGARDATHQGVVGSQRVLALR
jgi:hypothetical protein